ncbi:MAG: ABC transporter ATP-binding protein [Lachnospiraceae bacterium]|nr:ABC transporter ATP-binding protein [Lachnospiraceae bacterium]
MAKKNAEGYLSAKESRRISRENRKITDEFEKKRKRKHVPESEYLTQMHDPANAVEFDDLHTYFFTDTGTVKSVDGVTFDVPAGKTVGIVGESGCGKSVTSLSLMQLVQRPQGQIYSGEIRLNLGDKAYEISKVPVEAMQKIRGNYVSMIFQEPMTSLNPVFRIGAQVDEVIALHDGEGKSKDDIKNRTIELLEMVGIANSEGVYRMYPHELSGGMRQRVMIAMALACNPKVIIADEPTTALDVTIQAQILDLLRKLKDRINSSIMLITHDLGVIAEMADYVVVMYAGRIVEKGTAEDIFEHPSHPYTIGLMASKPVVGRQVDKLYSIPGKVPNPVNMPNYCYFKDRCEMCVEGCGGEYPHEISLSETHKVSCYRYYGKEHSEASDAADKPGFDAAAETDSGTENIESRDMQNRQKAMSRPASQIQKANLGQEKGGEA